MGENGRSTWVCLESIRMTCPPIRGEHAKNENVGYFCATTTRNRYAYGQTGFMCNVRRWRVQYDYETNNNGTSTNARDHVCSKTATTWIAGPIFLRRITYPNRTDWEPFGGVRMLCWTKLVLKKINLALLSRSKSVLAEESTLTTPSHTTIFPTSFVIC